VIKNAFLCEPFSPQNALDSGFCIYNLKIFSEVIPPDPHWSASVLLTQMPISTWLASIPNVLVLWNDCSSAGGEAADVTVSYESADDADEVGSDERKKSSSGKLSRRNSRVNSVASYHSVDIGPRRSDPSIRCVPISPYTQGFACAHIGVARECGAHRAALARGENCI